MTSNHGITKEYIKKSLEELNFRTLSEFAEKSGINLGSISRIMRGFLGISDKNAHKMILATINQNCSQGLNYLEAAVLVAESLNFSRGHVSNLENRNFTPIMDEDVERWYKKHIEILESSQLVLDTKLEITATEGNPEFSLAHIHKFLKSWKMKHDFDHLDKVKFHFSQNKSFIINFGIRPGMEQGLYLPVKDVFMEIRHIAHLCGEFEIIRETCQWLIDKSSYETDIKTHMMAKVTLAWTLTSSRESKDLRKAQKLVRETWQRVDTHYIQLLSPNEIDTLAILCELRLRLAIRLNEQRSDYELSSGEFQNLFDESKEMLQSIENVHQLEPRLKTRYEIPINYQKGIFLRRIKNYRESQKEFAKISESANLIGWKRVEEAAYSWLATLSFEVGDHELCLNYLLKIKSDYLPKRMLIREKLYTYIAQ